MLRSWFASAVRSLAIRRSRWTLYALPDRLLKDIGIGRSEIDYLTEAFADGHRGPARHLRTRNGATGATRRFSNGRWRNR